MDRAGIGWASFGRTRILEREFSNYCTTTCPDIPEPWMAQWYLYVPAELKVRVNVPEACVGDWMLLPSSKTTLCVGQV
jgi:hypothetical protein